MYISYVIFIWKQLTYKLRSTHVGSVKITDSYLCERVNAIKIDFLTDGNI